MPAKRDPNKRASLIRIGVEIFTEKGFHNTPIDEITTAAGVPKGSFTYYFGTKEAYALEVIAAYADYFESKLERHLSNKNLTPIERIRTFTDEASRGMEKYAFRRGCLIGNLGQELGSLDGVFRDALRQTLARWEELISICLDEAKALGHLDDEANSPSLAKLFWYAWEGAVLGAKLEQSRLPLDIASAAFLGHLASLKSRSS